HELLGRLGSAELSFAVPRPLPSDNGDTLRVLEGHLVAVFVRIPGETLAKDGGPYVGKAAAALAELDVALAAIQRFVHRPASDDALGQCDIFGRGYSSVLPLDPPEIVALPVLLELRAGVSFMHWAGRMRAGLATIDEVRPRAGRALFTYEWAQDNGDDLVRRAMGWIGERV